MSRLWACVALLLALLCASIAHEYALERVTSDLCSTLSQAQTQARTGDWSGAEATTRRAQADWEEQEFYLYATLRHSETDNVHYAFRETLELLSRREDGEYFAANAILMARLELLAEMEKLIIINIF